MKLQPWFKVFPKEWKMSFCFIISLKGVVITSTYLVFGPTLIFDDEGQVHLCWAVSVRVPLNFLCELARSNGD